MNRFEFYSNVQKYEKNKLNHSTLGDKAKGYMQDKHLYYKRIGNPGNYKYFYTKEEYDNFAKGQSNKSGAAAEAEREAAKRERYNDYKKTMNELGYSDADVVKNITRLSQNKWAKEAEKVKEASEKLKQIEKERKEKYNEKVKEYTEKENKMKQELSDNYNNIKELYDDIYKATGTKKDLIVEELKKKLGDDYDIDADSLYWSENFEDAIEYKNKVYDRAEKILTDAIVDWDNKRDSDRNWIYPEKINELLYNSNVLKYNKELIKQQKIYDALKEIMNERVKEIEIRPIEVKPITIKEAMPIEDILKEIEIEK